MKIDTYFIPPIKYLNLSLKGNRLFVLAHFILEDNQDYINFFKKQKDKFILLDSGVAEGHRVPISVYMKCAKEINASMLICPDELWNTEETLRLTKKFISSLSGEDKKQFKFMMVPQAKNISDYVKCLKEMQEMPECSCIGISKFDSPVLFGKSTDVHKICESRKRLVDYLVKNDLIKKPVHLLGYDNPKEFEYYIEKRYDFIRSCDSASAILCGIKGIKFNTARGINIVKPVGGDSYHLVEMNEEQLKLAKYNIKITKRLCNGK